MVRNRRYVRTLLTKLLPLIVVVALGFRGRGTALAASQSHFIAVSLAGNDSPVCGSITAPCRTIQYAIDRASSGDKIGLAQGVYTGDGNAVVTIKFDPGDVGKDLIIEGGYDPVTWHIVSEPSLTVVDGQGVRRGILIVSAPEISVELRNLVVRNGFAGQANAEGYMGEVSGGGLFCRNDDPDGVGHVTLRMIDVTFEMNRAVGAGTGNRPTSGGGASLYQRCRAELANVVFYGNEVIAGNATDGTRGGAALGGGLFATISSDVSGTNLIFMDNRVVAGSGGRGWLTHAWDRADGLGGGAAFQYSAVELKSVIASGNEAIGGSGSDYGGFAAGGALFFEYAYGNIEGAELRENLARGGSAGVIEGGAASGGGLMASDSYLTIADSQFLGNLSRGGDGPDGGDAGGGGVYFTKALPDNTSVVTGWNIVLGYNRAEAGSGIHRWGGGGAIFSQDTALTFYHATLVANAVGPDMQAAGLIALHNFSSSTVHLYDSIVADHRSKVAVMAQTEGDSVYMDHVLFHNNTGGNYGSQAGMTPGQIVSTHEHSGDPDFVDPVWPECNFRLGKNSAALDVVTLGMVSTDIDHQPRPFYGGADLGADEYAPIILWGASAGSGAVSLGWHLDPHLNLEPAYYRIVVSCPVGALCPPGITVSAEEESYLMVGLENYYDYTISVEAISQSGVVLATSNSVTVFPTDHRVFLSLILR